MGETLILTGTIAPSNNVMMTPRQKYRSTSLHAKIREREYYSAIKYYLEKSDFTTIIFCDNSNYDFSYKEELENIAKREGKILELIKFQGNILLSTEISYGAGEAEIFDYVYDHSKELNKANSFFKITGRYIVTNINEIISKTEKNNCYFNHYGVRVTPFHVATAVVKISNDIYKKYLYKKQIRVYELLKEYHDDSFIQLEQVRYILLRDFILNDYIKHNIPHIPIIISHMSFNKNKIKNFIFRTGVFFGLLDFNYLYIYLDKLFLSKEKKEVLRKLKLLND